MPSILFEGDQPSPPQSNGSNRRLTPKSESRPLPPAPQPALQELPETYGTQRLLLAARDPHSLYAHWDLDPAQLQGYQTRSNGEPFSVRLYANSVEGPPLIELPVSKERRYCFPQVERSDTVYVAELGYRERNGNWKGVCRSNQARTPPDRPTQTPSPLAEEVRAALPFEEGLPPAQSTTRAAMKTLPKEAQGPVPRSEGEESPLETASPKSSQSQNPGKKWELLIEALRAQGLLPTSLENVHPPSPAQGAPPHKGQPVPGADFPHPTLEAASLGLSTAPEEGARDFWFNLNVDLVVYGATDPRATVHLGPRPITLRPDGTFSLRFSLPDGAFGLALEAVAPDGRDKRSAALQFSRSTRYHGQVGQTPGTTGLEAPPVRPG